LGAPVGGWPKTKVQKKTKENGEKYRKKKNPKKKNRGNPKDGMERGDGDEVTLVKSDPSWQERQRKRRRKTRQKNGSKNGKEAKTEASERIGCRENQQNSTKTHLTLKEGRLQKKVLQQRGVQPGGARHPHHLSGKKMTG